MNQWRRREGEAGLATSVTRTSAWHAEIRNMTSDTERSGVRPIRRWPASAGDADSAVTLVSLSCLNVVFRLSDASTNDDKRASAATTP
jgi:hypothetical protein